MSQEPYQSGQTPDHPPEASFEGGSSPAPHMPEAAPLFPYSYGPPPYGVPPGVPLPYGQQPYMQVPRPRKKFLALWITLSIIGSLILCSCIGITVLVVATSHQPNQIVTNQTVTMQTNATATAQAIANNPYPSYLSGNGTLAFVDPLSQPNKWSSYTSNGASGACQFIGGAYHVGEQDANYIMWCPTSGNFSNFAFEVQLTITQGGCGGIAFRGYGNWHVYYFQICQDGAYAVGKYAGSGASDFTTLRVADSSAISAGLGQQNKIAVVANGDTMTFYVNEHQIDQEQDSNYTSGWIALVAAPQVQFGNAADVTYTNARLWTL